MKVGQQEVNIDGLCIGVNHMIREWLNLPVQIDSNAWGNPCHSSYHLYSFVWFWTRKYINLLSRNTLRLASTLLFWIHSICGLNYGLVFTWVYNSLSNSDLQHWVIIFSSRQKKPDGQWPSGFFLNKLKLWVIRHSVVVRNSKWTVPKRSLAKYRCQWLHWTLSPNNTESRSYQLHP